MRHCVIVGGLVAAAVVLSTALAGDTPVSGPQVGKTPTPFHPLNVTGPYAGQKQCLV
jgi:hypothetical protein